MAEEQEILFSPAPSEQEHLGSGEQHNLLEMEPQHNIAPIAEQEHNLPAATTAPPTDGPAGSQPELQRSDSEDPRYTKSMTDVLKSEPQRPLPCRAKPSPKRQ